MNGMHDAARAEIEKVVAELFDRMAARLVGQRPGAERKKTLTVGVGGSNTLAHLFIQSMGNREPLPKEADALKSLINTAYGFIEALRAKTVARLTERLDAHVMQARSRQERPDLTAMRAIMVEELKHSGNHFKTIAEAESTKARNVGKLMQISRVASDMGVGDPNVYFQIIRDAKTCSECIRLHTVDGGAPKVWKLSEVQYGYHKKGEDKPCFAGLHVGCRCSLVMLSPGFGFKNGRMAYIGPGHDEYLAQQK